jgi:hypothetical protein
MIATEKSNTFPNISICKRGRSNKNTIEKNDIVAREANVETNQTGFHNGNGTVSCLKEIVTMLNSVANPLIKTNPTTILPKKLGSFTSSFPANTKEATIIAGMKQKINNRSPKSLLIPFGISRTLKINRQTKKRRETTRDMKNKKTGGYL